MIKKVLLFVFCLFVICNSVSFSQTYKFTGKIKDIKTEKPLSFATVKIIDTAFGTTADQKGEYIIKLGKGYYKAVYTYIGYFFCL